MDLDREQESRNIEDRRGRRVSRGIAGGGIGTLLIILLALFFGFDPRMLLQGNVQEVNYPQAPPPQSQPTGTNDEMREFVARVLGSTERTWDQIFQAAGQTYQKPTLVLFSDVVESACGFGQAAAGPFYCGEDQKLYIDLAFLPRIAPTLPGAWRLRPGLRDRPRSRPSRAKSSWHHEESSVAAEPFQRAAKPMPCRSGLNCKRIALRASGRTMRIATVTFWSRAISKKD